MEKEDRRYVYEKAEQLAAESEELLNEARWFAGVESKDELDEAQISGCLEESYNKIIKVEELMENILGESVNYSKSEFNFDMAADMLEELRRAKKTLHESLNMLDKEDWHIEELADKINDVYINFDFESIEPLH